MYARILGHQNYGSRNPFDCTEIFAKLFDFEVKTDLAANTDIDKTSMYQIIYNLQNSSPSIKGNAMLEKQKEKGRMGN